MKHEAVTTEYITAAYVCVSVLVFMLLCLLFYVTCSRRFKLNWYEKTQLESAKSMEKLSAIVPDDSAPDTPNTPLGIKVSPFALSHMSQPDRGVSPLVKNVQPPPNAPRPKVATMYGRLDHTKIDATLYQEEQESENENEVEGPGGSLNFSVSYNPQFSLLCVHLIKARNLVSKDISGTADCYAKVRLLPDYSTWRESSNQWKTLNPVFDEELVFDLPESELKERALQVLFFDFDHYSRHQCMGKVEAPLTQFNMQNNIPEWRPIFFSDHKDDKPDLGDLMFSVGYLQSAERLTVVVLKAKNLKTLDEDKATPNPYVKVAIVQNGRRLKKKKTNTQRSTSNPIFNEALSFNNINKEVLKTLSLEFSVMQDNILGQNEVLGTVIVGPNSKSDEALHRRNFLSGKSAVAMWHSLVINVPTNISTPAD